MIDSVSEDEFVHMSEHLKFLFTDLCTNLLNISYEESTLRAPSRMSQRGQVTCIYLDTTPPIHT